MHGTTILSVRRDGKVAMAGDGQVSLGDTVVKHAAVKVRRLYKDRILAGFAGGRRTPSPCVRNSKASWKNTTATCAAPRSNWPATGAPTGSCAGSRR